MFVLKSPSALSAPGMPARSSLVYAYADYVARVVADGGVIVNNTICQAAWDHFVTNGISPMQSVYGAAFGVKHRSNKVLKVYAFDGNDMEPAAGVGDGPYLDSTGAFPVIRVEGTSAPLYLRARVQKPLLAKGGTGFSMAIAAKNETPADSLLATLYGHKDGATNLGAAGLEIYNNDFGLSRVQYFVNDNAYNPAGAPNGATQEVAVVPSYADYDAISGHTKLSDLTLRTYLNGVASGTKVVAPALYDYAGVPVRLYLSATVGGSIAAYRKQRYAEWGVIDNCTEAQAQAWSARMAALY